MYWVQFVYDMWYAALTPDREFPRDIRRVLNTAFGELAARARKADLKGMLLRWKRPHVTLHSKYLPGSSRACKQLARACRHVTHPDCQAFQMDAFMSCRNQEPVSHTMTTADAGANRGETEGLWL